LDCPPTLRFQTPSHSHFANRHLCIFVFQNLSPSPPHASSCHQSNREHPTLPTTLPRVELDPMPLTLLITRSIYFIYLAPWRLFFPVIIAATWDTSSVQIKSSVHVHLDFFLCFLSCIFFEMEFMERVTDSLCLEI
jgi:hypothetical protein